MAKKQENAKEKKQEKIVTKEKKKKAVKEKKNGYLKEVRLELKKVSFPSFKDVMKYTLATIIFCGLLVLFFLLLNLALSGIKGMFQWKSYGMQLTLIVVMKKA